MSTDTGDTTDEVTDTDQGDQVIDEAEYSLIDDLNNELLGGDDDSEVSTEDDESDSGDNDNSEDDSPTFKVKVDGEEIEVTQDELLAGYSRQSDYTKKTQALAEQAEQLQGMRQLAEALNTNPEVALQELARAFQVELGTQSADVDDDVDLDDLDPLERQVRELQNEIQQLTGTVTSQQERDQQAQEDAALQREIDQIRADNDDPHLEEDDLLRYAIDNKINDLGKAYHFMRLEAGSSSKRDSGNEQLEAKRNAPPITDGKSRSGSKRGSGKITSIVDAFAETMSEMNG